MPEVMERMVKRQILLRTTKDRKSWRAIINHNRQHIEENNATVEQHPVKIKLYSLTTLLGFSTRISVLYLFLSSTAFAFFMGSSKKRGEYFMAASLTRKKK